MIKSLGFEPKPGGEWAWGGSWDVTAQTGLLADDLGTTISSHDVQPAARIEKSALRYLTSIKEGQENNQQMRGPLRHNWPKLEEQQRRTLWAMGLV